MEKSVDILWEKVQNMQKAIELQAIEYERRLNSLNGEAERIKEILKESVPREVFDRVMSEVNAKIEITTAYQTQQQGSDYGKDKITKYIPWIIAALALAWGIFKK